MKIPLLRFRHLVKEHSFHVTDLSYYGHTVLDFVNGNKNVKICLNRSGIFTSVSFAEDGIPHRSEAEGPALCQWFDDGTLARVDYMFDGTWRRDPNIGPVILVWSENGLFTEHRFCVNGMLSLPIRENK